MEQRNQVLDELETWIDTYLKKIEEKYHGNKAVTDTYRKYSNINQENGS